MRALVGLITFAMRSVEGGIVDGSVNTVSPFAYLTSFVFQVCGNDI